MRPSRLWRALGASAPLFQVRSINHDETYDDTRLTSVTVNRGTTMRGFSGSAGSFTLAGPVPSLTTAREQRVFVELTAHGLDRIEAAGLTREADTYRRFHGRVTGQTTTDRGDTHTPTTVVDMQDWTSLAMSLDKGGRVHTDARGLSKLVESFYDRAGRGLIGSQWGSSWMLAEWPAGNTEPYLVLSSSDVARYVADAGMLVRTTRAGDLTVYSHDHLVTLAATWSDLWPDTLLRSQVIRPISWRQPDSTSAITSYKKITATGTLVEGSVTIGSAEYAIRDADLDLTHLREQGDGLGPVIIARASANGPQRPAPERVKVDLLGLIERGLPADLATVSQLINADQGDVVALAHDWPDPIIGVLFITTMTETMTRDEWSIELDLMPANLVTGHPVPPVHGRTWHSAFPRVTTWTATTPDRWDDK